MLRSIKTAALLGLSIVAASSDAHAQQSGKSPRIGVIVSLTSPSMVRTIPTFQALFAALRDLATKRAGTLYSDPLRGTWSVCRASSLS